MGIVVTFIAKGDTSGPDPFTSVVNPDATGITHGHMQEASNHGGPDRAPLAPATQVDTNEVGIAGFLYLAGDLGLPGRATPVVDRGEALRFTNLEPGGQIFHTVTSCRAPCNGATGISYPLANGPRDFDSLQLGYGPPTFTAAANTLTYNLPTSGFSSGEYTYFCRVHPFMRGAFIVR